MAKFIVRRLLLTLMTMLFISIVIFVTAEIAPGNIARNVLGAYVTPEQEQSYLAQLGLNRPLYLRYISWLLGSDWQAEEKSGLKLKQIKTDLGNIEWWAVEDDGTLVQWKLKGSDLIATRHSSDGSTSQEVDNDSWSLDEAGNKYFWGVDNANRAVKWVIGPNSGAKTIWEFGIGGWTQREGGPVEYLPLAKGFVRGDPGVSIKTKRPVKETLYRRLRNSLLLTGIAFVFIMPLAVLMGLIAGLNEGKFIDRFLSLFGLMTTGTPDFATGVILIVIFTSWLRLLPGATIFSSDDAAFKNPEMLILPVLTLTLIELGYVLRITRSSVVEVLREPYIRVAELKGLPPRRIVYKHVLRNALIAPITVIMLHVNWLIGGIVVVEAIFGFPGIGRTLYEAALFKDVFMIEAGAMLLIIVAMVTQLIADIIYTYLNPRIRYQ